MEYLDGVITELDQSPAIIEEVFTLVEGQTYVDYDLTYIYKDMIFTGARTWMGVRSTGRKTGRQVCKSR